MAPRGEEEEGEKDRKKTMGGASLSLDEDDGRYRCSPWLKLPHLLLAHFQPPTLNSVADPLFPSFQTPTHTSLSFPFSFSDFPEQRNFSRCRAFSVPSPSSEGAPSFPLPSPSPPSAPTLSPPPVPLPISTSMPNRFTTPLKTPSEWTRRPREP